jgi:proline dehydrogenase
MFRQVWRYTLVSIAESKKAAEIAQRYGMKNPDSFAQQFLAGETLDAAMAEIKRFNNSGIGCTTTILGESVNDRSAVGTARDLNLDLLERIHESGATPRESHISLKLTQLGLNISRDCCMENMTVIMKKAREYNIFVRIDMEFSGIVQTTLDIWKEFFTGGFDAIGVVLQAYLYRTIKDIQYVNKLGGRIRLVKGAYFEPKNVAYQKKSMVDANYVTCLDVIMKSGNFPAIATHDEIMIDASKEAAHRHGRSKDDFEFQQSYGIRNDFHELRLREGYNLRTTVPYGKDWFPYYTRRLAERPANALWVLKNLWYASRVRS